MNIKTGEAGMAGILSAWDDDDDPETRPYGYGETREAAINGLVEQLVARAENHAYAEGRIDQMEAFPSDESTRSTEPGPLPKPICCYCHRTINTEAGEVANGQGIGSHFKWWHAPACPPKTDVPRGSGGRQRRDRGSQRLSGETL